MAVAQDSTTIRVPKRTRTQLQEVAAARGVSLGELVSGFAEQAFREYAFTTEREAQRLDALNPAALAEYALWDETLGDGVH